MNNNKSKQKVNIPLTKSDDSDLDEPISCKVEQKIDPVS